MAEKKSPRTRQLKPCAACGKPYAPERQIERLRKKLGDRATMVDVCPACRRKRHAEALRAAQ